MSTTHPIEALPPFVLQHLAANHSKSRALLSQIQKSPVKTPHRSLSPRTVSSLSKGELEQALHTLGVTDAVISRLLTTYTDADIRGALSFAQQESKQYPLHNPAGFFICALTHGWDVKKQSRGTNGYKNEKSQPAVNLTLSTNNITTLEEVDLCKTLRQSLCQEIGEPEYVSWFSRTSWSINDAKLIITTLSAFVHTQLSTHFHHLIQRLLPRVNKHVLSCTFVRS